LVLNNSFPFTGSAPLVAAAGAAATSATGATAGAAFCAIELKENVSKNAALKIKILEIELWLPTFFIFCNDYRLKMVTNFTENAVFTDTLF
jgi:hypothetical protein